jgi:short subunit dehydrogenase-like uncharacterized protein
MAARFMIYGATGYTGGLVAHQAIAQGLRPILAGRDPIRLQKIATTLECDYRAVALRETNQVLSALHDIPLVLNTAGPFAATALPMVEACLQTGTHYLDVSGEIPTFTALFRRDAEARARHVMLMPGVGFAVAPSDCLAAYVARRLPGARQLRIGLSRLRLLSRGSAKTMIALVNNGGWIRRAGRLLSLPPGSLIHAFDYGNGKQPSVAIGWADVFTAFHTTGIPNIEVYVEANPVERAALTLSNCFTWLLGAPPVQACLKAQVDLLPEGPSEEERKTYQQVIVAEAEDELGRRACARLHTPETYTLTSITAVAIIKKVLTGEVQAGFQTPARVYGSDFVLSCDNVVREDVAV